MGAGFSFACPLPGQQDIFQVLITREEMKCCRAAPWATAAASEAQCDSGESPPTWFAPPRPSLLQRRHPFRTRTPAHHRHLPSPLRPAHGDDRRAHTWETLLRAAINDETLWLAGHNDLSAGGLTHLTLNPGRISATATATDRRHTTPAHPTITLPVLTDDQITAWQAASPTSEPSAPASSPNA
jgi:hypothetical protein